MTDILTNSKIEYKDYGGYVTRGLPSGLKMTSFLGSVANLSYCYTAGLKVIPGYNLRNLVMEVNVAGDDATNNYRRAIEAI